MLRSAIAHHMRVDVVNIMTFDYYDGTTTDMGAAAIQAARNLHAQLHLLYPARPRRSSCGRWRATRSCPGSTTIRSKTEVTYGSDARRLLRFAQAEGIGSLSIWAIQRDNGGCPGRIDANNCSGIRQADWAFSHMLERFDSR